MPLPPDDSGSAPAEYATICAFPGYSTTYNVKSAPYSAVGNGIADDTAAIQAAIDAAIAGGGHAFIYFPTGTYAVCRQTDTHTSALYQPIFDLTSNDTKDPSNLCFIGDGPTLSKIVGYMPSLGDPVTAYQQSTLGSPNPQMSRFITFFTGFVIHWSNLQFRSLTIDGQAGYTGDFTVGGSSKYVTFSITTPGTGYSVNDILSIDGSLVANFPTEYATVKVLTINGGGGVLTASLQTAGRYGSIPVSAHATIGGGGTGCTITPSSTALTGDGWDQLHKAFFLFEGDGCLIYNCDTKNFKGECIFGGSNAAVQVINGKVRSSNSSAISIGADLIISDVLIGGLTTDQVYNGTENFCFVAGQKTVIKRCTTKNDALGNGFVHLGITGSSLLMDDCDIYGNVLLSETAHNVTISNNRLYQHGIRTSNLALYPESSQGFHNFVIEGNACTGKSDGFTINFYSAQNGVSDGLVIRNNTLTYVNGPIFLIGGDLFQSGALVQGNTLVNGAEDIPADFGDTKVGLWLGTIRPAGTSSIGYSVTSSGSGDTLTIFPLTDATKLTGTGGTHNIQIDDTLMSRYPDGFETTFRGSGTFVLKKNALWNTFSNDVPFVDGGKITLNNSRLFDYSAPAPPPPTAMIENTVAFWDLDSDSADDTGNGRNGSDTDMSYDGTFATFNGSTSLISIANNAALSITDAITMAAWIKTTQSDAGYMFVRDYLLTVNGGAAHKAGVYIGGPSDNFGAWVNTTTSVDDGALHLIVATYDKATGDVKIYCDGSGTAEATHNDTFKAAITTSTTALVMGNRFSAFSNGQQRCAWLLSRAMTGAEVTTMYNAGVPKKWALWNVPVAGTLVKLSSGSSTASLSYATVTGGTAPLSNQLRVSTFSGSGYADIGSPIVGTTATFNPTGLTPSTDYYFVVLTTDANSQTATSNEVHVTTSVSPDAQPTRPISAYMPSFPRIHGIVTKRPMAEKE